MGAVQYTDCMLVNMVGETVTLMPTAFVKAGSPPQSIEYQGTESFKDYAVGSSSEGAVVYTFGSSVPKVKWIVAWMSLDNKKKTVFTEIITGSADIDWDHIKSGLEMGKVVFEAKTDYYESTAVITTNNATPAMIAVLRKI